MNEEHVDDQTILDVDPLWRRIPPFHIVRDNNTERWRPSSAAFEDHPNGSSMSVILGQDLLDSGRQVESALAGHASFSLAEFKVGLARRLELGVSRQPLDNEPAHAEVFGYKTKRVSRELAKASIWLIPPIADSPHGGSA